MRSRRQLIDIVTLTLCLGRKLIDQGRHQRDDSGHHLLDWIGDLDAAIQNTVEQILDRPGKLANDQRTHHSPTAFERMEGSADFTQRLLIFSIGKPAWQLFANGLQYLGSFLDENLKQILVDRLLVVGWRQEAGRDILGWWIYGCDRCRHDLFQAERGLGLSNRRRLSFAIFRQRHVR